MTSSIRCLDELRGYQEDRVEVVLPSGREPRARFFWREIWGNKATAACRRKVAREFGHAVLVDWIPAAS